MPISIVTNAAAQIHKLIFLKLFMHYKMVAKYCIAIAGLASMGTFFSASLSVSTALAMPPGPPAL